MPMVELQRVHIFQIPMYFLFVCLLSAAYLDRGREVTGLRDETSRHSSPWLF